jgi:hypothetical protein
MVAAPTPIIVLSRLTQTNPVTSSDALSGVEKRLIRLALT